MNTVMAGPSVYFSNGSVWIRAASCLRHNRVRLTLELLSIWAKHLLINVKVIDF